MVDVSISQGRYTKYIRTLREYETSCICIASYVTRTEGQNIAFDMCL